MTWWPCLEKKLRTLIYGDHSRNDARARAAYHKVANEAQALNARLRQIKRARDPWYELVKAVRGCDHHEFHHED